MSVLNNIEPKKVFEFFELISSVPHGSDNTAQISKLCCEFASQRSLEHYCDKLGNVIIYKAGSPGYELHEPVIIQGHMDMVAVKTPDSDIDLEAEGLKLNTDDKYVWADSTSLGADDGIAVAMAMAVLDSDCIAHPPIEAVFTINEETGMDGAQFLDVSHLKGKRMLNIDSEVEGVITCGCAGGVHMLAQFDFYAEKTEKYCVKLIIQGLTGGHSGSEIHKNRANANILIGKLLAEIKEEANFRLVSVDGGEKDNAIANEASAVIAISESDYDKISAIAKNFFKRSQQQYKATDPQLTVNVIKLGNIQVPMADETATNRMIRALSTVPNGVQSMSSDIAGLVEASLNLGVVKTENSAVSLSFCLRSSAAEKMKDMRTSVNGIIEKNGGTISIDGEYPAWEYKRNSALRDKAQIAYESLYGAKPELSVIHAGLECGLFADKIKDLDCISFGPNIPDIHTTSEKLDIASTQRVWEFFLKLLQSL